MVLSLSASEGGACEVLDTACGAQDGVEDGGAMLVEGASGLEGGFKTKKGKSLNKTTCWFILKKIAGN